MEAELERIKEADTTTRFGRTLAVLLGITALVASMLAALYVSAERAEGHASALASRLFLEASDDARNSSVRLSFDVDMARQLVDDQMQATGRMLAAISAPSELRATEEAIGSAEQQAAPALATIGTNMESLPRSGLDPRTWEALSASPKQIGALVDAGNSELDEAGLQARKRSRTVFALTLLALVAVLFGLAGLLKKSRSGQMALSAGALLLVLTVVWGTFALAT